MRAALPGQLLPRGIAVRLFSCPKCRCVLFFENTVCTQCSQAVGYAPELAQLVALPKNGGGDKPFQVKQGGKKPALYSRCQTFLEHDACNWLVSSADHQPLCRSCRLTEPNPELTTSENRAAWFEIEQAKRRLLYTLDRLGLPVVTEREDASAGLLFRFQRGTDEHR